MDATTLIRKVTGMTKTLPKKSFYAKDWLSWYRGRVLGFHNYKIYNGTNYLELERKTLGISKFVVESWANLLMNEKCDIIIPEEEKDKLDKILQDTNFWQKANEGIEKSFALGIGALIVNVIGLGIGENSGRINIDKAKISIDFVNETKIFPITLEDKNVTECAFVSTNTDSTYIVIHLLDDRGIYKIHNYVLDDKHKVVKEYVFDTKSEIPWFFVLRPNISSNFITEMVDDEIGISIYANSLDNFRALDNKYDGFDLEYVLGRKRMFVSTEAWTINKNDGTMQRSFDPYDTLFYHLPDNDDGKPLITNTSDNLRYDAYVRGINTELQYISMKTGLGESFFKFDGQSVATATQVISENSTLFRNIKKHQILLEDILRKLTKVVIKASTDFTSVKFRLIEDKDIKIMFDDSIFEDKGAEMDRDRLDVQAGIMSVPEYREKWYGEDEKTANEKYNEHFLYKIVENYQAALTSGAMTPTQYVEKVFPYAQNKDEIIDYISSFVGRQEATMSDFLYDGNEQGLQENVEEKLDVEENVEEIEEQI
jgi:A118 family predicted phage portal protein